MDKVAVAKETFMENRWEATEENVASTDSGQQARKPDPDALKAVR